MDDQGLLEMGYTEDVVALGREVWQEMFPDAEPEKFGAALACGTLPATTSLPLKAARLALAKVGEAAAKAERERIVEAARRQRRYAWDQSLPPEVARTWSAVAGWVRAGADAEPDLRGPVPDADDHPDTAVALELRWLRAVRRRIEDLADGYLRSGGGPADVAVAAQIRHAIHGESQ